MYCAVLLCMALVKGIFKMLVIQDPELMQLMHEQKSLSWHKQLNQPPIFELPFKSYFLFLIFAIVIGQII
jgi:hypothetical protein